jgi:hypothetical protein
MPTPKTAPAPTISPATAAALHTFLEYTPPARLNRNLRKMLMAWLITGQDSAPAYYEDLLHDLNNQFELLDDMEANNT